MCHGKYPVSDVKVPPYALLLPTEMAGSFPPKPLLKMAPMAKPAIDFEAEGLLDGLEGEPRQARSNLLGELSAEGVSVAELHEAVAAGRLTLLPVERALAGTGSCLGIASLRHRIELLHGTLRAGPEPDGGFCLEATLPAYVPTSEAAV